LLELLLNMVSDRESVVLNISMAFIAVFWQCAFLTSLAAAFSSAKAFVPSSLYLASSVLSPQLSSVAVDPVALNRSGGLFAQPIALNANTSSTKFSCSGFPIFNPNMTILALSLPKFLTPANMICNPASLGAVNSTHCRWVPQTFLGMLYDRGIELMRHNVSETDAFQVYASW
jgi:hypothetical protein